VVAISRVQFPVKYPKTGWNMQVGDLVKYDSVAKNWLCYGIVKEFKTVDSKEMVLVFWHKNSPFTFSDRRERQSWVLMDALTKISET